METKLNTSNKQNKTKEIVLFFSLLLLATVPIFADNTGLTTLNSWSDKIIDFLGGGIIKSICLITLAAMGISVVVQGKQGGDMRAILGKFAPWAVGVLILLSANDIINVTLGTGKIINPITNE